MTSVTVTVENGSPQVCRLQGRPARIVLFFVEQAEALMRSTKGQVQIDYAGEMLVIKNTQITEHRGKK